MPFDQTRRRLAARSDHHGKTACSLRLARRKYNRIVTSGGRILALDLAESVLASPSATNWASPRRAWRQWSAWAGATISKFCAASPWKKRQNDFGGRPGPYERRSGRQGEYTREFARELEYKTGLPVKFWDERWTSREAERVLRGSGIAHGERKPAIDRLSGRHPAAELPGFRAPGARRMRFALKLLAAAALALVVAVPSMWTTS